MSTAAFTQATTVLVSAVQSAVGTGTTVVLTDPSQGSGNRVSVWLYQVAVDEFSRNAPAAPADSGTPARSKSAAPPLGINLYYLITPLFDQPEAEQQALAQVMLYLYENPILAVYQPDVGVNDQVRVTPLPDSLADRATLWQALTEPFKLSMSYIVRTVRLISPNVVSVAPVGSIATGLPASAARG